MLRSDVFLLLTRTDNEKERKERKEKKKKKKELLRFESKFGLFYCRCVWRLRSGTHTHNQWREEWQGGIRDAENGGKKG